ncbi:MAG: hypothetical protein IT338_15390 [Thermomicrobiales bacterium]|nr:hypothetical protein [Thermomicrobiales bacterium]
MTTRTDARSYHGIERALTGDAKQDALIMDQAADAAHDAAAPAVSLAAQACGTGKTVNGSYNVDGKRARYSMKYSVSGCTNVKNVKDQAWTNAADSGDVRWEKSCTNGNNSCRQRNIVLTNSPTSWKNEDNSAVGRQYRHQSINLPACRQGICINSYGYWDFD